MLFQPDVPFAPKRVPFFYGWVIVAVSTIGVVMSIPGQTMGVSVFTDSLLESTGLSRFTVSNTYLAGTILSGLTLPWAGTLLDRLGARATGLFAAIGLGLTLLYLSSVDRVADALGGAFLTKAVALVVGFYCLRFCGQGVLTMVSRTMLGRWFDRRRGLVAGVSGVFVAFGFGGAPLLFDVWIESAGWRGAWREMAFAVALGMGAIAYLFYRDNPERCGLRMDGAQPTTDEVVEESSYTRRRAIRTLAFWAVTGALACQALIVTGITFHVVDLGAQAGLDRSEAVAIFLPMAVVSTGVGLLGGVVADRARIRTLLVIMMASQIAGVLAATDLDTYFYVAVVGLGISGGLFSPISTVAFPRFFGRKHLGAIAGLEMMCLVVASALGPSLLAASRTYLDSYTPALLACLALPATAIVMALTFRRPG